LSTNVSALNWAPRYEATGSTSKISASIAESDYTLGITAPTAGNVTNFVSNDTVNANVGGVPALGLPSGCFCFATNLETSSGMEISGLNAEEQSDISLNIKWSGGSAPAAGTFVIETYVFYDAMIVLRENNVLVFLQLGPRIDPVIKCVFILIKWIILNLKLIRHMQQFLQ
jgi:hypothetical protein